MASGPTTSRLGAKIAGSDFGGHYSVGRRQKAWFLPAALAATGPAFVWCDRQRRRAPRLVTEFKGRGASSRHTPQGGGPFMLRLVSIAALILAGASTLARADVFRWIDKDGVPHYSDEWVPGSVVIKTTVRPHNESAAPSVPSAARASE